MFKKLFKRFDPNRFVDVEKINPKFCIDIRYATTNNFAGKVLYPVAKCYLRKKVASKLNDVQNALEERGLGLKIFDGYRPLSVQKIMWEIVPDERYVANPAEGSKHNRGSAVDVTLVDSKGQELRMPTGFDDFSVKAHRDCFDLPNEAIENRDLLEKIMVQHGFIPLPTEWWHFDDAEWEDYPIEDVSLESLR